MAHHVCCSHISCIATFSGVFDAATTHTTSCNAMNCHLLNSESCLKLLFFVRDLHLMSRFTFVTVSVIGHVWNVCLLLLSLLLFSLLGKPADRAIYFAFRSFFLFLNADKLSQDPLDRFSWSLDQIIGICLNMTNLDLFLIPQGTLPWQPILWQNLGICIHLAERHLKTACNIAIRFENTQWQYISYILCNNDENRSSNPRDYEGNKCTFLDETAKIGLSHLISHQLLDQFWFQQSNRQSFLYTL